MSTTTVPNNRVDNSNSQRPHPDETSNPEDDLFVPLEAPVLVSSENRTLLGVTNWVGNGELFVVTGERIPVDTEVVVSLALPSREETIRLEGEISFWHDASTDDTSDREGMGVVIDGNEGSD